MCPRVLGLGSKCEYAWMSIMLTIILKIMAGTRQTSPGIQKSIEKMTVTTTLVTKAYLGSLVSSVCCATTIGG